MIRMVLRKTLYVKRGGKDRLDVYPARFVSRKTRQPGYAPACANKWRPGLGALLTGGKCGNCAHQAFIPVSDQVVLDRLQGRHTMGVYPLLEDETCWLLAVDFDKCTWREDVTAFAETADAAGLPVTIERSRSGSGAHKPRVIACAEDLPHHLALRRGCLADFRALFAEHGDRSGEGFDDPHLDTLFLAMPVSWKGTLIQYSGRLHRYSPGKAEVRIDDYVDSNVPVLARMFNKRMTTYKAIGYSV